MIISLIALLGASLLLGVCGKGPDRTYHMVNITQDVEITMPQLTELVLEDGSDVTVSGFGDGFEAQVDFVSALYRE